MPKLRHRWLKKANRARKALEAEVEVYAKAIGEKILGRAMLMEKINWKKHLKVSATVVALVAGATVVWASGGGDGHAAPHNVWHDIDTWKVLNFVLLVIGCFFIARKPVAQFFSSRTKGIEEEVNKLGTEKSRRREETCRNTKPGLENLEQESEMIVEDYIKQGEDAKKRILEEAEARLKNSKIWQSAISNKSLKLQRRLFSRKLWIVQWSRHRRSLKNPSQPRIRTVWSMNT